jgi:hypothetical protein
MDKIFHQWYKMAFMRNWLCASTAVPPPPSFSKRSFFFGWLKIHSINALKVLGTSDKDPILRTFWPCQTGLYRTHIQAQVSVKQVHHLHCHKALRFICFNQINTFLLTTS